MTVLTEGARPSDAVIAEFDPRYCRETITISNGTGGALTYEVNEVLEASGANFVKNATDKGDAILLEEITVGAGSTGTAPAIVRGPAIVNADQLAYNGGDEAAIKTDLLTNLIKAIVEPTKVTAGT